MVLMGGTAAQAQTPVFDTEYDSDTVVMAYTGSSFVSIYNKLRAPNEMVVTWRMIDSNFPSGWSLNGFCDNKQCYGSANVLGGANHTTNAFGQDTLTDFHAQMDGSMAANNTSAYITVQVKDPVSGYTRNLTFIATKGAMSVSSAAKAEANVHLYPMPARDALNITFDEASGIELASIYNLIGKAVSVYHVQGNSAKFDVSSLPAGMYLLRLMTGSGAVISTRKFTHQ